MNKKGTSITWLVMIMFVILGLAMAHNAWDAKTVDNFNDALNWTNISTNVMSNLEQSAKNAPNEYYAVAVRIIEKMVDFMGYAIFEVGKMASKFAYENPDIINYKVLFALLILSLLAPLIYPAFMLTVSIILLVKEWFEIRKEKKELNRLRENGM